MAKKKKYRDPFSEREAKKYENPIPSRELILEVISDQEGPVPLKDVFTLLKLDGDTQAEALRRRLRAMERDGQLVCNRRRHYLPVKQTDLIRGRVIGHRDGFGFLKPDEGGDDLFLSARQMRSLLHGDRALVRVVGVDRRGRREAALVEVLERQNEQVVGRFIIEGDTRLVVPDNKRLHQDILIPHEHAGAAKSGQIVLAAITIQPTRRSQPIGKVVEVLGDHMDPGMEIDIAIQAHDLPNQWPEEVNEQVSSYADTVNEAAKQGRVDLRELPLVTIDGEDAKDFDDAVYCEPNQYGWKLWVAIADVSSYVQPDSPLDQEAYTRGTSVYFPGRVIPMLPEVLSNGLCSLNPEVDRLCMVCELQVGRAGGLGKFRFYEAVMRSHARLTYTQVAAVVVDRKKGLRREFSGLVDHLDNLFTMYKVLRKQRSKRGAIDFESAETYFEFGEDKKIKRILPMERNDAHKVIEECMIAANVCAAKFLAQQHMPALYRVHEGPKPEKLEDLRGFLAEMGLRLSARKNPKPKDYARLIDSIGDRPDAHLIQTVLLRSLAQAVYTPDNIGHFGLAHEEYTHFTSPIRRYPDLLVHRAIRHILSRRKPARFEYQHNDMVTRGEHCSMTERRADDATRDAVDWLKCEYMLDKVGEKFKGIISTVTSFGLFVQLTGIHVEGLIHITSLPRDYYHFDPMGHRLNGERSGRVYRLGDPLRVMLARVDLDERKIDFELIEKSRGKQLRGKQSQKKRSSDKQSQGKPSSNKSRGGVKKRKRTKH